jgi:hypothetical protein
VTWNIPALIFDDDLATGELLAVMNDLAAQPLSADAQSPEAGGAIPSRELTAAVAWSQSARDAGGDRDRGRG